MWSIELNLEVLFELDHDGVWFYLNNLVPHSDNTTRLIPVPTVKCSAKKGDFVMIKHDDQAQLAKGKVQVGDSAPDFTLPDQSGVPVSLGHFLGKTDIVLYFYRNGSRQARTPHSPRMIGCVFRRGCICRPRLLVSRGHARWSTIFTAAHRARSDRTSPGSRCRSSSS